SFTDSAIVELIHCTLAENTAAKKGGALHTTGTLAEAFIQSNIIAQNQAEFGPDMFGTYSSRGTNLIGTDTGYNLNGATGEKIGNSPSLDLLGLYGGPTETFRLQSSSPAIDAAASQASLPLDQRGESRTFGAMPDIGAYEYDPATSLSVASNESAFSIYPNPTQATLWVTFDPQAKGIWRIHLIDLAGRQVWHTRMEVSRQGKFRLDLPQLPAGMYLVQGQNGATHHSLRLKIE
ncbi:MAG: T9SS type A sorting domain-containing protein, partial [Bacteroidota bacterium]